MIFYKYFPYSPLATLISVCGSVGGAIAAVFAIYSFSNGTVGIIVGILLVALAVVLYFFVNNKLAVKLGQKWSEQNIRTKLRYAIRFCKEHPEAYEELSTLHPELVEKYEINEKGKLVKRK